MEQTGLLLQQQKIVNGGQQIDILFYYTEARLPALNHHLVNKLKT